jgi:hypothetical protein
MTYNGYSNYETWAVQLWIDNSESSSAYWRRLDEEVYNHQAAEQNYFSRTEDAACILADNLRLWLKGAPLQKIVIERTT